MAIHKIICFKMDLQSRFERSFIVFSVLAFLEVFAAFVFFLFSPSDPENALVFGFSAFHLGLVAILFFFGLLILFILLLYTRGTEAHRTISKMINAEITHFFMALTGSLLLFALLKIQFNPSILPSFLVGFTQRLYPIVVLALLLSVETIALIFYWNVCLEADILYRRAKFLVFHKIGWFILGNLFIGIAILNPVFINSWIMPLPAAWKQLIFILPGLALLILFVFSSMERIEKGLNLLNGIDKKWKKKITPIGVFAFFAILSFLSIKSQFDFLGHYGQNYIGVKLLARHIEVVQGIAYVPYRYRLLSEYLVEVWRLLCSLMSIQGFPLQAFIFRFMQNILLFHIMYRYLRSLGFGVLISLTGVTMLFYSVCMSYYNSPLAFDTYMELIFLLSAVVLKRDNIVIPLTILGALNREGAVFIPIIWLLGQANFQLKALNADFKKWVISRPWLISGASLILFLIVYLGIRAILGGANVAGSGFGNEITPGLTLFWMNLTDPRAWTNTSFMYAFLPLSILGFRFWPVILKKYLVGVAIPWFILNYWFGTAHETRLFLLPLTLVFIPASLFIIRRMKDVYFSLDFVLPDLKSPWPSQVTSSHP